MWGCFQAAFFHLFGEIVFPTRVGVFLVSAPVKICTYSLPHACGGVSEPVSSATFSFMSSPHMWGCFSLIETAQLVEQVFPTHVGLSAA